MRETTPQTGRARGGFKLMPMRLEGAPLEHDDNADPNWFAPIAMLIAWLAHLFEQIAKLKRIRRTTKFKPNWRDHWPDLRQCEWMRDQILASGAAQLLAGQDLDLDAFIPSTEPPADYGGPCPKTPFEMNRRFLAMARFNADPEPAIRAHAATHRASRRYRSRQPPPSRCCASRHLPRLRRWRQSAGASCLPRRQAGEVARACARRRG